MKMTQIHQMSFKFKKCRYVFNSSNFKITFLANKALREKNFILHLFLIFGLFIIKELFS